MASWLPGSTALRPEDIEALANVSKATEDYYRFEGEGIIKRLVKLSGREIGAAKRGGYLDKLFVGLESGCAYCPATDRYIDTTKV